MFPSNPRFVLALLAVSSFGNFLLPAAEKEGSCLVKKNKDKFNYEGCDALNNNKCTAEVLCVLNEKTKVCAHICENSENKKTCKKQKFKGKKICEYDRTIDPNFEWTGQTAAAYNSWRGVTYGNGTFVAVSTTGTGNRVMTSPDGINWTSQSSAADNSWISVTYGKGIFVAVSYTRFGNYVMTSPDGMEWTSHSSAADTSWRSVTYENDIFVAVGGFGAGIGTDDQYGTDDRVMTSPDGIVWTSQESAADNAWTSVTYGNGIFVAVSHTGTGNRVMTSPDGIEWTSQSSAADNWWLGVTYGEGIFVAVSRDGTVMTSTDGIAWTSQTSAPDKSWRSVTYGNGIFVAVGAYGTGSGTGNLVMTSPDGIEWTSQKSAVNNDWLCVTYGKGIFVAVSFSGVDNRVMTWAPQIEKSLVSK